MRAVVSFGLLGLAVAAVLVLVRTRWITREIARIVRTEVARQTGLMVQYQNVGFSWYRLAVRVEDIEVRHPREGMLARIDTLEIAPAVSSLLRKNVKIAGIDVDGGFVRLRFRHGVLVNGPSGQQASGNEPPSLPFRDLAISDLRVRIEHDAFGTLDLFPVDIDVRNVEPRRILLGTLVQGGNIRGSRCFDGSLRRFEARAELTDWRTLQVALARLETAAISVSLREATVPLDLRGSIHVDGTVSGPLAVVTCAVPGVPPLHGTVTLQTQATVDPRTGAFQATGRLLGTHLALDAVFPDRTYVYSLGDEVEARFVADSRRVQIASLRAVHSGGTIVSPGRRPDRPVTIHLGEQPTLEGHVEVTGLELHRLLHDISVTSFAKVVWTLNARAELHGELWRFAERPDPRHPALLVDIEADTRDFAILRDYHQWSPRVPVIEIPRGTVTGQIAVDSEHVRFQNLVGRFGPGGRSRVDVDMVQIRTVHDDRFPDILLKNARGHGIHLEDIGHIAGIPIAGEASATAHGGGPFADPVIVGEAHLRNFHYNDFPLGDYDTLAGAPWRFRNLRVDFPAVEGRAGRSVFTVRNGYLDFSRYTLVAGARIASNQFHLADYFHMFKFEGDPVFEPYEGGTMSRCGPPLLAAARRRDETPTCLEPGETQETITDASRDSSALPDTETGHIEADVSFVLGRPGDDPDGVMNVDFTGRNLWIDYVNRDDNGHEIHRERISHVHTRLQYTWLVRSQGYRGGRLFLEYARGKYAGGTIEVSGNGDLGGQMHFAGRVYGARLERTGLLHDRGLSGLLDGTGALEGTPDAQRWTLDTNIRELTVAERNVGDVTIRVRANPEGPRNPDPDSRPPPARWTVDATALNGDVTINAALRVPWQYEPWRDVDGQTHPDWTRAWRMSELSGSVVLTRPVDVLPWLPVRLVARLGTGAVANARARVDISHAVLNDLRNADARVTIDRLELGAQGIRLALAPGEVLTGCLRDGTYWIDSAAAESHVPCTRVPARLGARANQVFTHDSGDLLPLARFVGPEGTRLGIGGGGTLTGSLGLSVQGQVDLSRIASMVPGIDWARGIGSFHIDVTGTVANPRLSGTLRLENGAVGTQYLPSPVDHIDLLVRLEGTDIQFERASARFGASSIDMTGGWIHLRGRDLERLDVPVVVRNLSLLPQPGVEISLDADTHLTWNVGEGLPRFSGEVTLGRVRYTRPVNLSLDLSGNVQLAQNDATEGAYDPSNDHLNIDVIVRAREPIRVNNNLAEAEIRIAENERPFRLLGTDQRLGALGTLDIPAGRVHFRGNDFEIRRGRIEFDNPERIAPTFDIMARTEIRRSQEVTRNQQWRIDLHAYGTADRFSLDMSADPPLSREDIALMLAFRMTRAELDALGAGNLGQHLAFEALATATGIDRVVRQYVPIVHDFQVGSGYSPSMGRTVPQISAGSRINDQIRVGGTLNTGTDRQELRGTLDWRLGSQTGVQLSVDNTSTRGGALGGWNVGADLRWRIELE